MSMIPTQLLKPLSLFKESNPFYQSLFGFSGKVLFRRLVGRLLFQVMTWPKVQFSFGVAWGPERSFFICLFGFVFIMSFYPSFSKLGELRYVDVSLIDGDLIINIWHNPDIMVGFKYFHFALFDTLFGKIVETEIKSSGAYTGYVCMPEGRYDCILEEKQFKVGRPRWIKKRCFRYVVNFPTGIFSHEENAGVKVYYRFEFDWPFAMLPKKEVMLRLSLVFLENRLRSKSSLGFSPGRDWNKYLKPWRPF